MSLRPFGTERRSGQVRLLSRPAGLRGTGHAVEYDPTVHQPQRGSRQQEDHEDVADQEPEGGPDEEAGKRVLVQWQRELQVQVLFLGVLQGVRPRYFTSL